MARAFVLGMCLFAANCQRRAIRAVQPVISQNDQSNTPGWDGGWSIIGRGSPIVRFSQTFTPLKSTLAAVEIDVMTGNQGRGADDIRWKTPTKNIFGWRYGLNTYPGGVAHFNGAPWNGGAFDFRFRTYGY